MNTKNEKTMKGVTALCLGITLLVATVSAAGVFLRGDGSTTPVVSVRGERYDMVTTGVYRFNAERVVAEGVGWDFVTLFLAVPAMLLTLPALLRGSLRGRLFALGILAYFFYQYLEYAVFWAFGPLFVPFILIFPASAAAFAWIVSTIRIEELPSRFSDRFPRRGMAALCITLAVVLTLMWTARIAAALGGEVDRMFFGQPTMTVQALDLGFIVPLAIFTGVTVLRRRPVGYLLSAVLVVKAVAMSAAISAMLLVAWSVEGTLEAVPLAFFAAVAAVSVWLGLRMFHSAVPEQTRRTA